MTRISLWGQLQLLHAVRDWFLICRGLSCIDVSVIPYPHRSVHFSECLSNVGQCRDGVASRQGMPQVAWIEAQLGMVSLLGSQVWWTWETEDAFRRIADGDVGAMKVTTAHLFFPFFFLSASACASLSGPA
jgi:hypothetical protein